MAIDVDTVMREIFHGYGAAVWTELFRPPYICNIPRPAYDPQGAAAMLEQAGWTDTNGDGVRECHGCSTADEGYPMSFEFATYGEYGPELELAQQLIGEMLGNIGMAPDLRVLQGAVMWADVASGGTEQNGDFDLDMYDDGYPGIDPTDHLYFYYDSASAVPDAGFNAGRWINEGFDGLLDEAYTLDEDYRRDLFCQMAQILDDELPQILLFSAINADAHSTRLQGVQSSANDMATWNVADWTIGE
jgi:peptide/nickel transport system substrate-binding protein